MDAIKWIEKDVEKSHQTKPWLRTFLMAVALFFPILFGLGLRGDFHDVFTLRILVPNLISAMLMIFAFKSIYEANFHERVALRAAAVLLVMSVFVAAERVMFPAAPRTTYISSEQFWVESSKCFMAGAFSTSVLGIYLGILSFLTSSWPTRAYRALIAAVAGVSGMVMLSFHCDSSSIAHVFLSHFGQGVIIGLVFFLLQEAFYAYKLKQQFPKLTNALKDPGNLSS